MKTTPDYSDSRKAGFTVLEVLIVIGLILFMLAIMVHVYQRVQEGARRRSCQALIHKLGMALLTYRGDFPGQGLPPDTGFGLPLAKTATYDSFSLWRYLGKPIVYNGKVYGPYVVPAFSQSELTRVGNEFTVSDPWGRPIGYVGDPRRVIHTHDFDIYSGGPDKKTGQDFAWAGAGNPALAYDGTTKDTYGVTGGAVLMGPAALNGTLTVAQRIPLRANEVRDDHNNWDPQQP